MTVNTLDGAFGGGKSRGGAWLLPLAPIAISIFAISALVSYHLRADSITPRTMAQSVVIGIYDFLGWVPACMFFGLVFAWSSIWFVAGTIDKPLHKLSRVFLLTLALAVFGNLDASAAHTGALGSWIGGGISSVLGSFLSHLVMAPLTFLALLFATDYFWMSFFERRVLERTKAELQSAAAVSDAGVEPAVPEEFKQLARSLPPEAQSSAADADAEEVDVANYFDRMEQRRAEDVDASVSVGSESREVAADVDAQDEAHGEEPVRLSYFERRRLREEQEALRALQAANAAHEQPEPIVDETIAAESAIEVESSPVAAEDGAGEEVAFESEVAAVADASDRVEEPVEVVAAEREHDVPVAAFEHTTTEISESVVAESAQPSTEQEREEVAEAAPVDEPQAEFVPATEPALFAGLGETLPEPEAPSVAAESVEVEQAPSSDGVYEIRTEPLFESAFAHVKADADAVDADDAGEAADVAVNEDAENSDLAREAVGSEDESTTEIAAASASADADAQPSSAEAGDEDSEPRVLESASDETERVAKEPDVVEIEELEDEFDETAVEEGIRVLGPVPAAELPSAAEAAPVAEEVEVGEEPTVEIPAREPVADLSSVRPRGFLAPVVEDDVDEDEVVAEPAAETDARAASAEDEPVVAIPRADESPRQKSLFGNAADEALLREAQEICESSHRPSAVLLQRKLRIDFELARAVLAQLAERGIVELQEDGTQARVRS